MDHTALTYICPGCGSYLRFDGKSQEWVCDYCGNTYGAEELEERGSAGGAGNSSHENVEVSDIANMRAYSCPSCGAEILTDDTTAATFCVFCGNPAVLPVQFTGEYRPAAVVPFETDKEDAKKAFLQLCKGKKLLPKGYTDEQRLEKITGVYVPFWLFDCRADFDYRATGENVTTWRDTNYIYTKTDQYHIHRAGRLLFESIPLDASEKMPDDMMDALEPFDLARRKPFDMGYLSGFLAEKYTYLPKDLYERMTQRITPGVERKAAEGRPYHRVYGAQHHTDFSSERQVYMLLPVWMLVSRYKDRDYLFAMNGQTGKIVGELPCSTGQMVKWFMVIFFVVFAVACLLLFGIGGALL